MLVPPSPLRRRGAAGRALSVILSALMVMLMAVPASATRVRTDLERIAEERFLALHDSARGSLGPLAEFRDIRDVARAWSDQMADRNSLQHNGNYASQVCCYVQVGENIAMRSISGDLTRASVERAVDATFEALMASTGHRENIQRAAFEQIGIGVSFKWTGSQWRMWSTMDFRDPDGSEPAAGVPHPRDIRDTCGSDDEPSFKDVPKGSTHAASVACLENQGITQGKRDGTFGAKDHLSRGQVATFLLRTLEKSGKKAPAGQPCKGTAHAIGMSAMIEWKIFSDTSCEEARLVGRSEMAVWSVRAMQGPLGLAMPNVEWDLFFDDNNLSGGTQGSHNAIAEMGVVTGVGNEKFAPEQWLMRDQMATFLARILDAAADA